MGIDLASQPERTAACRIDWVDRRGEVYLYDRERLTDGRLLELMLGETVMRVGIDAPFGWPDPFVDALAEYRAAAIWPIEPEGHEAQREQLVFRMTDHAVTGVTMRPPLSVSSDLIAVVAMRCARLLSALVKQGVPLDRSGGGRVVEVYPAVALRRWELSPAQDRDDPGSYKGNGAAAKHRRAKLVTRLLEQTAGWLLMTDAIMEACRDSDHQVDALLCALIARASEKGMCSAPPSEHRARAGREGWIMLPNPGSLTSALA